MKRTKKSIWFLLLAGILLAGLFWVRGDVMTARHERQLQKKLLALPAGTLTTLEEAVPFAWDVAYTFDPYTSRRQIEEAIGFSSRQIEQTVSEGQMQLLFVKGRQVVASVCGFPSRLGYRVDFSGSISGSDTTLFAVTRQDGLVVLTACPTA